MNNRNRRIRLKCRFLKWLVELQLLYYIRLAEGTLNDNDIYRLINQVNHKLYNMVLCTLYR